MVCFGCSFPYKVLCNFIKKSLTQIKLHYCYYLSGINDQGLYRVVGVSSKVQKLLSLMIGKLKSILFVLLWKYIFITSCWKELNKVNFLIYMLLHYLCDIRLPLVSWMCWRNGCVCRGDIKKIVTDNQSMTQPIRTMSLQRATSARVYPCLTSIEFYIPQTTRQGPSQPRPCTFWLVLH